MKTMVLRMLLLGATVAPVWVSNASAQQAAPASPYAGEQARAIKSLSEAEIEGYLAGAGMGFAKAAELNHYPGPKHVLELADELELNEAQRSKTIAIMKAMKAEAIKLGTQLVAKERALDAAFAASTITVRQLDSMTAEIASIHGKLRAAHIRAHIEQRAILSAEQVSRYDQLRGYGEPRVHDGHSHQGHDPH